MPEASLRPRRRGRPRADPDRLPPRMHHALNLFLSGATYAEIARAMQVKVDTVRHWFSDERMRRALDRELYAMREMALGMLAHHAPAAAQVILEGLRAERFSERLRAADMLLERAGLKAEGPRLTLVELPRVVEVGEAPPQGGAGHGHGPDAPASKCFLCSPSYLENFMAKQVWRRVLAVSEHRDWGPGRAPVEVV
jgi:transposase-like protein